MSMVAASVASAFIIFYEVNVGLRGPDEAILQ